LRSCFAWTGSLATTKQPMLLRSCHLARVDGCRCNKAPYRQDSCLPLTTP
jgi:hypothetical protein